ncbi:helix-turn-helix domain-containing protein [Chenggangzhangella methanolivorans]|uniref:helix-turn-helix domain-containing protein n=1 Tax=Chenggangzhangella methanolivorans TaxID=1437009 RepID=UPI00360F93D5
MNVISAIRKRLRVSQSDLAVIAGTTQATVSRWESGDLHPDLPQMAAIREAAQGRDVEWDDAWFFTPAPAPPTEAAA